MLKLFSIVLIFFVLGEQRDPNLAQFSNLVKCLEQEQGRSSGSGNMDWRQWQNVAQSNDLSNVWNRQTTPPWGRPGDQRPPIRGPGYNQGNQGYNNNPGGQPRPGVHPDDWNNRQPGTGSGYAGNNMNWPQNQDNVNNRDRDRERSRNENRNENRNDNRRRNRNKNRRKDQNIDRQQNNEVHDFYILIFYDIISHISTQHVKCLQK